MLLKVNKLNTFYGNIHALWDINIEINESEIVALIGSNGAGKSTLLNTLIGAIPMKSGTIEYDGEVIAEKNIKPNFLVPKGMILSPEGRRVFPRMTVEENLKMGGYTRPKKELCESYERVYDLFPRLFERKKQLAGTLSGGEQQMLAIGRAVMGKPKLLMLDEPSLGLSPILTEKIFEMILEIQKQGVTILLVEQNAVAGLSIANRGYVLKVGSVVKTGQGKELLQSADILESYLGGS